MTPAMSRLDTLKTKLTTQENLDMANDYAASSPAGAGNSEPGFVTGNAIATQAAWLILKTFGNSAKVQIYY